MKVVVNQWQQQLHVTFFYGSEFAKGAERNARSLESDDLFSQTNQSLSKTNIQYLVLTWLKLDGLKLQLKMVHLDTYGI